MQRVKVDCDKLVQKAELDDYKMIKCMYTHIKAYKVMKTDLNAVVSCLCGVASIKVYQHSYWTIEAPFCRPLDQTATESVKAVSKPL